MKNTKKGFTLVELLVVIAIVAILATVAIIGYTSFLDKADESADIYAVRQMNTVLQANVEKPTTIIQVSKLLKSNGFNVEDGIVPLYEGRSFYWYKPANLMVYVNEEGGKFELVYPENIEGFPASKNDDCQTMPTVNPEVALTVPSVPADEDYSFASSNINGFTVPTLNSFEETVEWINTLDDNGNRQTITCKVNGATKKGILLENNLKLTQDIVLDVRANDSTLGIHIVGDVTIDLNGHKIIQKGQAGQSLALFVINAGATLNIFDSSAEQTGAVCAGYAFEIHATGTLNIYSGKVCVPTEEYRNTVDKENYMPLIWVYGGTLNLYGGTIDATYDADTISYAILGNGAASSTANLYAGTITGYIDEPAYLPNLNNYGATITE